MTLYNYWDIFTPEKLQSARGLWVGLLCCLILAAVVCVAIGTIFNHRKGISIICIAGLILSGCALSFLIVDEKDCFCFQPKSEREWESYREGNYSECTGTLQIVDAGEKTQRNASEVHVRFKVGGIYFLQGIDLSKAQLETLRQYAGTPVKVQYSVWPSDYTVYSIASVSAEQPGDPLLPEASGETVYDFFAYHVPEAFGLGSIIEIVFSALPLGMALLFVLKAYVSDTKEERMARFISLVATFFVSFVVVYLLTGEDGFLGQSAGQKRNWEQYSSGIYSEYVGTFRLTDVDIYDEEDEESSVSFAFDVDDVVFYSGINYDLKGFRPISALDGKPVRVRYSAEDGQSFIYTLEALPDSEQ